MSMRHRPPGVGVEKEPSPVGVGVPVLMAVAVLAEVREGTPDVVVIAHPGVSLDRAPLYGHFQPPGTVGIWRLM